MIFLLKCVFWLGLVFHAMSWPATDATYAPAAAQSVRMPAAAAPSAIVQAAASACAREPALCLEVARRAEAAQARLAGAAPTSARPEKPARRDREG